jgi:signal transduction histidine kinase
MAEVRLSENDEVALIEVIDYGPGMPAEIRDALNAGERPDSGSPGSRGKNRPIGIGLSLARRLSDEIGARLWFETPSEGGTIARLSIPLPALSGV